MSTATLNPKEETETKTPPACMLHSRDAHPDDTVVDVDGVAVGGERFVVIAGPCAVESEMQMMDAAEAVREAGGHLLRGGAYKPRTNPYSFQGLGEEGLRLLRTARAFAGLPAVSEVIDTDDVDVMERHVECLQVGARNCQNFSLLKRLGRSRTPVLLKRGMSQTIDEWLCSAEYILAGGNPNVILCERGIRTFETATRNTLDLGAVALLKERTHLPVVVDPSHATGRVELVAPLARAAIACGADGVMIEMHPNPVAALSDGPQSATPEQLKQMIDSLKPVAAAMGRTL